MAIGGRRVIGGRDYSVTGLNASPLTAFLPQPEGGGPPELIGPLRVAWGDSQPEIPS